MPRRPEKSRARPPRQDHRSDRGQGNHRDDEKGQRTDDDRPEDDRHKEDVTRLIEEYDRRRQERVEEAARRYRDLFNKTRGTDNRPHWTPWLLIRYKNTDLGLRPTPSGDPFWASPDVWVESTDPSGDPVAGQENFVHARIFNLGRADAAPVKVDFFWANPAMGLGAADMNLIGSEWVEVGALSSVDVRCSTPWVPVMLNDGHECLMVNCHNQVLDPILHPFQPTLDRHVGQRNVHVIAASAGATVKYSLSVNNMFPFTIKTMLSVRIEHIALTGVARDLTPLQLAEHLYAFGAPETNTPLEMRRRFSRGTQALRTARQLARLASRRQKSAPLLMRSVDDVGSPRRGGAAVGLRLSATRFVVQAKDSAALAGLLSASDLGSSAVSPSHSREILLQDLALEPLSIRQADLEFVVPPHAKSGEFVVFHLSQRAEGIPVGGYSVGVRIV